MMCRTVLFLLTLSGFAVARAQTPEARRVAVEGLRREADQFIEIAPQIQGREVLMQTHLPRIQRQVVSAYGFVAFQAGGVREIRQVEEVDGKRLKNRSYPLKELAANVMAADDKQRRKLLESFEKHGLQGVAVDFGPAIQMFAGEKLAKYEFIFHRMDRIGTAALAVYRFEQIDGAGGLTIYSDGKPIRQKLQGEIWVRPSDGVPARLILDSVFEENKSRMRDLTQIDYSPSEFRTVLPATVVHRQFRDRSILVQDYFRYSDYRKTP